MSALLTCSQGHHWWEPFSDGPERGPGPTSSCPRCGEVLGMPERAPVPVRVSLPLLPPPAAQGVHGTLNVELNVAGTVLPLEMSVPAGPTHPVELLPVFRQMAESLINLGVRAVEAEGKRVSCQKACGACCRQIVPISEFEARHLRDVVAQMPEPRRAEVRARFAEARKRLEAGGLLEKLLHPERFSDDALRPLGIDYFAQGVPCPFLDGESCSIYAERPISCREYLVTSPAVNCVRPTPETIRCLPLAGKVSSALTLLEADPNGRFVRWVPLIIVLEWADTHPDETPARPGPDWLRDFFQRLITRRKPAQETPDGTGAQPR